MKNSSGVHTYWVRALMLFGFCPLPLFAQSVDFSLTQSLQAGLVPATIVAEDFDSDGNLDLAIANAQEAFVTVYRGNGDGTFIFVENVPTEPAFALTIGDFNEDGIPDLAVASRGSRVSVLLGDGIGSFQNAGSVFVPGASVGGIDFRSVKAADFNDDGHLDIVAGGFRQYGVAVLFGNGTGGLSQPTYLIASITDVATPVSLAGISAVAVGDFNEDDNADIAVLNRDEHAVYMFYGNGEGGFSGTTGYSAGAGPRSLSIVDVSQDGHLDMVVGGSVAAGPSVLIGDGHGNFTTRNSSVAGTDEWTDAIADFNQDGALDIAAPNDYWDTLDIALGDNTGLFAFDGQLSTGGHPRYVAAGDFNNDGLPDLAVSLGEYHTTALIYLNNANRAPTLATIGNRDVFEGQTLTFTLSASDLDGDVLTYSASDLPVGASFDAESGVFSWTPTFEQSGDYEVTFTATDDGDPALSDSETITITVVDVLPLELIATADSFLRSGNNDRNEGANPHLNIQASGHNRAVVAFDEVVIADYIAEHGVTSAQLIFTIVDNGDNWGATGRTVDAHPLLTAFAEGNGKDAGVPNAESTRGVGAGVTWNCATDTAIENQATNCSPQWNGGSFGAATAPTVLHINNQTGEVSWDVTADVLNGSFSWLIKKTNEGQNGRIEYYSKEGATAENNPLLAPRLLVTP